jgi:hypothetical protein
MYAKAMCRLMLIAGISVLAAACAPTYAPHLDAPPTSILAPLDPPPQLPDAEQSPCPRGSGLAACFTRDQDGVRQLRFKLLHDDRDYCRDAYARALTRSGGGAAK